MIGKDSASEKHLGNGAPDRKEYAFRKAYVRELWRRLGREHRVVCLFGAGKHTVWLLKTIRDLPAPQIEAIFDEQPRSPIEGIPVFHPSQRALQNSSAIFISSDSCEEELMIKARSFWGGNIEIIAPYQSIGTGPFAGEETGSCDLVKKARARLAPFKNRHVGQTGFVLGNGPSLQKTNLGLLRSKITFGLNRIYLLYPSLGYQASYYCCVNTLIIEQCAAEINSLPGYRFLGPSAAGRVTDTEKTIYISLLPDNPLGFSNDPGGGVWQGATVTFVALQLAYYMGFNPVVLTGVDHSFKTRGDPHSVHVSQASDMDHFTPDYFGAGFRWHLPDLEMSEIAYRMAHYHYQRSGREIFDATVGGQLNVFPKRKLEEFV